MLQDPCSEHASCGRAQQHTAPAAQVFVPSKDGTVKIPMFIVAKKNVTLDGSNPTFLYAYGGAARPHGSIFLSLQCHNFLAVSIHACTHRG
jgi:prolyl oligopeptidase PreP (S9A serine peptidase family)